MSEDKLLINYPKSNNSEIISNKQIEKMAKDSGCPSRHPCKGCLLLNECDRVVFAERLYDKNYREQSEGEWVDFGKTFYCSVCKKTDWYKSSYCPNCGARMSGGKNEQREAD